MKLVTKVVKGIAFGDVSNAAVRNILTEISKELYGAVTDDQMEETLNAFGWKCPYTGVDLRPLIEAGTGYATDHIYPQNRTWCGLNVKGNLIIVAKAANDKKNRKDIETFLLHDDTVLAGTDMATRQQRLQNIRKFQADCGYDPKQIRDIVSPLLEARYEEVRKEQEQCISDMMAELAKHGIHPKAKAAPTATAPTTKTATPSVGKRDYSKYSFQSQTYTKGALVVAIVEEYLKANPDATLVELKNIFNLVLTFSHKPMIMEYTEVPKSWADKVLAKMLSDGTMVYINKQVMIDDMPEILRIVDRLKYDVKKI